MNSDVRADNVTSPSALEQIFARVRPMGFTPLASALERKVLEPYYEMLRCTPAANVKPLVIYVCSDGAPTTERGLKTYQPTFTMLNRVRSCCSSCLHTVLFDFSCQMDSVLQSFGLPRKTIGMNVTQIGLDDVRLFKSVLNPHLHLTAFAGGVGVSADSGRPSAVRTVQSAVHANHDSVRRFGDRIDCVSDFEVEMVQVWSPFFLSVCQRRVDYFSLTSNV